MTLTSEQSAHRPARPRRRWIDLWLDFRDRKLQDVGFQRFAARFPLTRPIARKRAGELFDLVGGFVYSQILQACVRLDVFGHVRAAPLTIDELAPRLGLRREAAARLIEGAAALRLLQKRGGETYGLGDLGAALLANPGVMAMVEHHAILYADLSDPVALLKADPTTPTGLSAYWSYARAHEPGTLSADQVGDYSRLMAVSQAFVAAEILDAYPIAKHQRVMDIGGGEGAFILAAARHAMSVNFTLFDLPAVADRARARFAAEGLGERTLAVGGDLFNDRPLPAGADLLTLIRVLYDHSDDRAMTILRKARQAVAPGGALLIAEPMAGTPGAEAMGAAYFGFYLYAMRGGASRSAERLSSMAKAAGFSAVSPVKTHNPLLTGALLARP